MGRYLTSGGARKLALSGVAAILAASCGADPQAQTGRLVEAGRIQYEAGNYRLAEIFYRRAIQLDRRHGEAHYELGRTHAAQQEWTAAAASFWRAYECRSGGEAAFRPLAEIYLRIYTAGGTRDPPILRELTYLIGLERARRPESADVLLVEGLIALADGQHDTARSRFEASRRQQPDDPRITLFLCRALAEGGDRAAALRLARDSIEEAPSYLPLYDFLHSQLAREGRWDEAGRLRQQAVARNPHDLESRIALAAHHHRTGNTGDMEQVLRGILAAPDKLPGGRLAVAEFYLRLGRLDEAQDVYEQGLKQQQDIRTRCRLGLALVGLARGEREKAIGELDALVAEDPHNIAALTLRAAIHLGPARSKAAAAIRDLVAASRLKPGDPFLRYALGEAYLRQGDSFGARNQFAEALEREPGFLLPKMALASLALADHEYEKAQVLAREVLEDHPEHRGAQLLLADTWIGLREFERAEGALDSILKRRPRDLEALHARARLRNLQGRPGEALRTYRRILAESPGDPRALDGLVGALAARGELAEAQRFLEGELRMQPEDIGLSTRLAWVESRMGAVESALNRYRGLADRHPNRAYVYARMGEAYVQLNRLDLARNALEQAVGLDPASGGPRELLGVLDMAEGNTARAMRRFEETLDRNPDSVVALNNLAHLLVEENRDPDRAISLAQRARALAPHDAAVADTLAWAFLQRRLAAEAEPLFRDLARRYPGRARYHCGLARALAEAGRPEEARQALEAALRCRPSPADLALIESVAARLGRA